MWNRGISFKKMTIDKISMAVWWLALLHQVLCSYPLTWGKSFCVVFGRKPVERTHASREHAKTIASFKLVVGVSGCVSPCVSPGNL